MLNYYSLKCTNYKELNKYNSILILFSIIHINPTIQTYHCQHRSSSPSFVNVDILEPINNASDLFSLNILEQLNAYSDKVVSK